MLYERPPTERHNSLEIFNHLEGLTTNMVRALLTPSPRVLPSPSPLTMERPIFPTELSYLSAHDHGGTMLPKGTTYVIYKKTLYILTNTIKPRDSKCIGVLESKTSKFNIQRSSDMRRQVTYGQGVYYLYEYRV